MENKNRAKIAVILFFILLAVVFVWNFSRAEKYGEKRFLMGTSVQLDVCVDRNNRSRIKKAYKDVWKRLEDIAWRMSIFEEDSEISRLNRAFPKAIKVQEDTYQLIKDSMKYTQLTKGAFDITVLPLINLWKEIEQLNRMPSKELIQRFSKSVGLQNINLLPDGFIGLTSSHVKIDLGGIAKGYAIDEAARIFRANRIDNFFIDAGGDVYVGGMNCKNKPWRIGIRDPRNRSEILDIVLLSNAAVTTSGNYEQYYEIQGKKFSHIIDPRTGYPQEDVVSATVIASTATESDALSTALCVLGAQQGIELIDSLKGSYAGLIITKKPSGAFIEAQSRNYKKFQLKNKPLL